MNPLERARLYVRVTRKLSVMRDDLIDLRESEHLGNLPGGIWTANRLQNAIDIVGKVEADYRAIAVRHLKRAGQQPPLF